jgi:HTH-type transcriptional regulator/antitoxin HigA
MSVRTNQNRSPDSYFELVRAFPLRRLTSDRELQEAIGVIDSLLDQSKLDRGQEDYLDVLSDLVKRYEADEHPMEPVPDADLLRHLIEAKGVSQQEAAQATEIAESTISEVLSGKRSLSRSHIGRLARYFGVSRSTFNFAG